MWAGVCSTRVRLPQSERRGVSGTTEPPHGSPKRVIGVAAVTDMGERAWHGAIKRDVMGIDTGSLPVEGHGEAQNRGRGGDPVGLTDGGTTSLSCRVLSRLEPLSRAIFRSRSRHVTFFIKLIPLPLL